ncbi:MAG TPA: phage tail tip lysozyme [Alphaproteobacteria bacterium]|nr:phage tail tip lysozyme [Alphaproteobacteria bacterium]
MTPGPSNDEAPPPPPPQTGTPSAVDVEESSQVLGDGGASLMQNVALVSAAVNDNTPKPNLIQRVGGAVEHFFMGGDTGRRRSMPLAVHMGNGPAMSSSMAERARFAVQYFEKCGWTQAQAIGITANLIQESGLNIHAVGDNGQARGLAQWHPDRVEAFERATGQSFANLDFEGHLGAINWEMTQGGERHAGNMIRNAQTPEDAARAVSHFYERCGNGGYQQEHRAQIATNLTRTVGAPSAHA